MKDQIMKEAWNLKGQFKMKLPPQIYTNPKRMRSGHWQLIEDGEPVQVPVAAPKNTTPIPTEIPDHIKAALGMEIGEDKSNHTKLGESATDHTMESLNDNRTTVVDEVITKNISEQQSENLDNAISKASEIIKEAIPKPNISSPKTTSKSKPKPKSK